MIWIINFNTKYQKINTNENMSEWNYYKVKLKLLFYQISWDKKHWRQWLLYDLIKIISLEYNKDLLDGS